MDYPLILLLYHFPYLNTTLSLFIFYVSQYKDKDFSFSVQNGNAKIPSLSNDKRRDFWIKKLSLEWGVLFCIKAYRWIRVRRKFCVCRAL